jgi:hypothetical protein
MKISIKSISGHGDYDKEVATLTVNEDCDAGFHVLSDTTYTTDGKISALLRHMFWLPDKQVKKGDFIFIYTKTGTNTSFANNSNTTTHAFYWGLKTAVWNDDKDCAVLFEIGAWQHKATK